MQGGWEVSAGGQQFWFHTCRCIPSYPIGCFGYNGIPFPKQGGGFVGLTLSSNSFGSERGFAATTLLSQLQSGQEYVVEFYYRAWSRSNYHANRLGIKFTTDTIAQWNVQNYYGADVELQAPITDTTQWLRFTGAYIAQGGETQFTIGNFATPAQTNLIPNPPNTNQGIPYNLAIWPMVFVDGVMLYKATDTLYTATLPNDTLLCPNEQLVLQPILDGFKLDDTTTTYLWSTGSTDSTIVVTQPGTYWVQTTINQRFVAGDTIVVDFFPANYQLNLPDTVTFCEGTEAVIQAAVLPAQYALLTAYLWNTGSTLTGIAVRNPGLYYLNAQTPCYNLADSTWALQDFCESYLWVPNAFTPDGDGTNDFFEFQGAPAPVKLSIFDRWGKQVFYSDNYQNNWDGTYQGQDLQAGVYTYLIEYLYINPNANQPDPKGSERQVRGKVTIIR